jgi:hypothetical protein
MCCDGLSSMTFVCNIDIFLASINAPQGEYGMQNCLERYSDICAVCLPLLRKTPVVCPWLKWTLIISGAEVHSHLISCYVTAELRRFHESTGSEGT